MHRYSYAEMADIHLTYGAANGNGREAARLYAERFPQRRHPHHSTFPSVDRRLRETGTFRPHLADTGRPRFVRTPQLEETILEAVSENPQTSTRSVASDVGVSNSTVWSVLHEQLLYPYHFQKVQHLLPDDFPSRSNFCQWFINQTALARDFPSMILFSDEASFTRTGIFNNQNMHAWDEENPHVLWRQGYQHRFSINVWCGIISDFIVGPHVFHGHLTGPGYRDFLEQELPVLLEDVPLAKRRGMWYMHDGAPAHSSMIVREYLNDKFPGRWIGRGGPIPWPARSPDLNPIDFYLWGHLKSVVYETPIDTEDELLPRIQAACHHVRTTPGVFERVRQAMLRRCQLCIEVGGRHMEHLL